MRGAAMSSHLAMFQMGRNKPMKKKHYIVKGQGYEGHFTRFDDSKSAFEAAEGFIKKGYKSVTIYAVVAICTPVRPQMDIEYLDD